MEEQKPVVETTLKEDMEILKQYVRVLKNKYVVGQRYFTAAFLRDIERLVQDLAEFDEPVSKIEDSFKSRLDELASKLKEKSNNQQPNE